MPAGGTFNDMRSRLGLWVYRITRDLAEEGVDPPPLNSRFGVLKAHYDTDRLYAKLQTALASGSASRTMSDEEYYNIENLRSPAFEATEFHVGHWFPGVVSNPKRPNADGALRITKDSPLSAEGRQLVYDVCMASNWDSRKQTFARTTTWSGNGFIRVGQRESDGFPFKQVIEPQYVRAFKTDERGFLTYFHMAYPKAVGRGKNKKKVWKTEVFDKERGDHRIWVTNEALDSPEDEKGFEVRPFKGMGIDFIPVVWAPFMETAPGKGMGVFEPFLDRVDNVNRAATRLHDMLFRYNKPVWALQSAALTADNMEMPPPDVVGGWQTAYATSDEDERAAHGYPSTLRHADGTMTLGNDVFMKNVAGWELASLVPQVDYTSALAIVNSDLDDLKRVMPELRYNDAMESAARDSALVVERQLAGAVDRAIEARGNAHAADIRADQMALTMGRNSKCQRRKEFRALPDYKGGELDFEFELTDILPRNASEKAAQTSAEAQAVNETINVFKAAGLSVEPLKPKIAALAGVDESELDEDASLNPEGVDESNGLGDTENELQGILAKAGQGQNGGRSGGTQNES